MFWPFICMRRKTTKIRHSFVFFWRFPKTNAANFFKKMLFRSRFEVFDFTQLVKMKIPQDLILKTTEYSVRNNIQDTDNQLYNIEVHAKT